MQGNLLKRITSRGVHSGMNASEEKIVVITNYILLLAAIVAFLRIFMFIYSGDLMYSIISLSASILFYFAYLLNSRGHYDIAKFFLIIVGNAAVLIKEVTSGGQGNQLFLIMASFSTVFLLFNIRKKGRLLLALLIPAISFAVSILSPEIFHFAHKEISIATLRLEKFFGVLSGTIIIIFVTWYFVKKSADSEEGLIAYNEQLRQLNNEILNQKLKIEELHNKTEILLFNTLPIPIANRLRLGETLIADHYSEASIIFIDIVSFTKLTKMTEPRTIVNELNSIFTTFDKLSEKYGIEKIKTLGDCYMAVSGLPAYRKDHAVVLTQMAIEALDVMKGYKTIDGHEVKFRIGIDSGPVVAGVIGEKKLIYDLWGEAVNTASRMKDFGIVDKIQCTEDFKNKITEYQTVNNSPVKFEFTEREEIEIKGMGRMKTYFLSTNHQE